MKAITRLGLATLILSVPGLASAHGGGAVNPGPGSNITYTQVGGGQQTVTIDLAARIATSPGGARWSTDMRNYSGIPVDEGPPRRPSAQDEASMGAAYQLDQTIKRQIAEEAARERVMKEQAAAAAQRRAAEQARRASASFQRWDRTIGADQRATCRANLRNARGQGGGNPLLRGGSYTR